MPNATATSARGLIQSCRRVWWAGEWHCPESPGLLSPNPQRAKKLGRQSPLLARHRCDQTQRGGSGFALGWCTVHPEEDVGGLEKPWSGWK